MKHATDLDRELASLRRSVSQLRLGLLCGGVAACVLFASSWRYQDSPAPDVLRVKGLIVEDAEGRARVLLGAPVPRVPERVRTDRAKATAAWGERYGGEMDWYFEDVSHDAFGLLVLDERGHDRLAFASPTPDPCTGPRIEPSHGIQINDAEGVEVGGFGYFVERAQVGLGMDNPRGEGLYLLAAENGTSGMVVQDHESGERLFVGLARGDSGLAPTEGHLGASLLDGEGTWWSLQAGEGFVRAAEDD